LIATLIGLRTVFTDALVEIISKTAGITLAVAEYETDSSLGEVAGLISLNGMGSMTVLLSAKAAAVRRICSFMTGTPEADVTEEELDDTLCELVNITAGNVKLRLGSATGAYTLSPPFTIRGADMRAAVKWRTPGFSVALRNGEVELKLRVICS
jgi:CheY-specific phosphatase CheX